MVSITGRFTLYVVVFCFMSGLLQGLGVLPGSAGTSPIMDTTAFIAVDKPGESFNDPMIGGSMMLWSAVQAVIGAFWSVMFIFGTLTQWGIDPAYAVAAQGILITIYGYDIIALWKGWDVI